MKSQTKKILKLSGIIQKGGSGGQPHGLPAATENQHPPMTPVRPIT